MFKLPLILIKPVAFDSIAFLVEKKGKGPLYHFNYMHRCTGVRSGINNPRSSLRSTPYQTLHCHSEDLRKTALAEHSTVFSDITLRKEASKMQYKPTQPSHAYTKPRPLQRKSPWILGQVVASPLPRTYAIKTGKRVLRPNGAQLQPAAHPRTIPQCSPPRPSAQFLPSAPAISLSNTILPDPDHRETGPPPPPQLNAPPSHPSQRLHNNLQTARMQNKF